MSPPADPVSYMDRTKHYYRALGYAKDYVWATHADAPFAPLPKPLADCRIALITTAHPPDFDGIRRTWAGSVATPPATLHTDDLAWDKESTHTEDRECFLPIETASALAAQGVFAGLTARFHGVPTDYSQKNTIEDVAPLILQRLREDGADAAILCPL
jgi:D-proline reductase (dithiol) PrdB